MAMTSDFSAKIKDMKTMPWPMALVVCITIVTIGVLAVFDKDVNTVVNAILFLLMALGYAELREIKSQTNGNTASKDLELAATRRANEELIKRLLESPPLNSQFAEPGQPRQEPPR